LRIDEVIFNIEDYVGGNIEGVEKIDRMGFTVFLRKQLTDYATQQNLELLERLKGKIDYRYATTRIVGSLGSYNAAVDDIREAITSLEKEIKG